MKKKVLFQLASALLTLTMVAGTQASPWSFGAMSDTQWKTNLDANPEAQNTKRISGIS